MSQPTLEIRPLRRGITPDGGQLELLIRVVAPARPESETAPPRQPLDLALVIDRSGSMGGEPLHEAKRCAQNILARLQPTDRASLVVYDNRVDTLVPLQAAQPIAPFEQALNRLQSRGNTDLFGGWEGGLHSFGDKPRPEALRRILLLSDGCANAGLTCPDAIARHCAGALESGIGTTTIGLGAHFNEELMSRMALAGGGRSYYGEKAEDLLDAFSEEFALLSDLHSRRLRVDLHLVPGVKLISVAGRPPAHHSQVTLPDVAWDSVGWAQVTFSCEPSDAIERLLGTFTLSGEGEAGPWTLDAESLVLPVVDPEAWAKLPEDSETADRLTDTRVGSLLESARAAIHRGDVDSARQLIGVARGLASKSPWLLGSIDTLEKLLDEDREIFAKEALYARGKMASRLVAREDSVGNMDRETREYLVEKARQGRRRDV
jgi:Ca-activated chloride channel family protein